MSGVVISKYWKATMSTPSALMTGTLTSLYDVGAVFGAIGAGLAGERLGRKKTFLSATVILMIGTILMGSSFGRAQFMVSRILTGIGIGWAQTIPPNS